VGWGEVSHDRAMTSLYLWMFTSKWIKLLGHYIRYPVDVFLLPVSVLFGYFHGAIKMYAVMTLNVVSVFILDFFYAFAFFLHAWRGRAYHGRRGLWFCGFGGFMDGGEI
jgi:hypothetical protein